MEKSTLLFDSFAFLLQRRFSHMESPQVDGHVAPVLDDTFQGRCKYRSISFDLWAPRWLSGMTLRNSMAKKENQSSCFGGQKPFTKAITSGRNLSCSSDFNERETERDIPCQRHKTAFRIRKIRPLMSFIASTHHLHNMRLWFEFLTSKHDSSIRLIANSPPSKVQNAFTNFYCVPRVLDVGDGTGWKGAHTKSEQQQTHFTSIKRNSIIFRIVKHCSWTRHTRMLAIFSSFVLFWSDSHPIHRLAPNQFNELHRRAEPTRTHSCDANFSIPPFACECPSTVSFRKH